MSHSLLGMGSVSMWGLTPAMDLRQFVDLENKTDKDVCNILLIGQSDARHVLYTLAKRAHNSEVDSSADSNIHINFYIVETSLELYARQMLLLALACQTNKVLGVHEKCVQFMELYGNILVRYQTKKTLLVLAEQLIKMITDEDYLESKFPLVKLQSMKFLERDRLVDIMKYWLEYSEPTKTDMEKKWDIRLRNYLATRYDSRLNIFDWDYNMKLVEKDKNASIISVQEYKGWRNTGIAFSEFDSYYSQPNVTLNSVVNKKNDYSYCGDTITGPFVPYGIRSEESSLFEKVNDKYKNNSFNVTYNNLQKIFEALRPSTTDNSKNNGFTDSTVHFLPVGSSNTLSKNNKFHQHFDLIYIAASSAQKLTPELIETLAPRGKIIVEKTRYSLEFRKEHEETFQDKVKEFAVKSRVKRSPILDEDLSLNYFLLAMQSREENLASEISGNSEHDDLMSDWDSAEVAPDWETLTDSIQSMAKVEEEAVYSNGDGDSSGQDIEKTQLLS